MNSINKFFSWIIQLLSVKTPVQDQKTNSVRMFAQMLQNTRQTEISCDEVFQLLDQYTELANRGENVAQFMPLIKQHLEMCKDCYEEYEALKSILEATSV